MSISKNYEIHKPPLTGSSHQLPFNQLAPLEFERLCLWLVLDEGFEKAEHLGEAGSEQGRDIRAWKGGKLFAFQCKRVESFGPSDAEKEIDKVRGLPQEHQPDEIVFIVTKSVRVKTRDKAREKWGDSATCHFWCGSELDERVKRFGRILEEFFQLPPDASVEGQLNNLPFATLGSLFKGRGELAAKLGQILESGGTTAVTQAQALSGLGGIGKTRLAVEYAWRSKSKYSALLFVQSASPEELRRNLAKLAGPDLLSLAGRDTPEEEVVGTVLSWLRSNAGWLLIFDNVDSPEAAGAVRALLPRLTGGHVILTSRLSRWPAEIHRTPLDVLGKTEASQYLLEKTSEYRRTLVDDVARSLDLAGVLGGLPLALEQCASYIVAHGVSFDEYLSDWERERQIVLGWYDEDQTDYPRSVAVTWQQSFQQLDTLARAVLNVLSHLAPDPIPVRMLSDHESVLREAAVLVSSDIEVLETNITAALAQLTRYSLVHRHQDTVSVHRMVQEVVRARIPKEEQRVWLEKTFELVTAFAPDSPDDVRTWSVWDPLRPHVRQVIGLAERAGLASSVFPVMNKLAVLLSRKCVFHEAEPLMKRALSIAEKYCGKEHSNVGLILCNLAALLQAKNRLSEAEPLLKRALSIAEASFGKEHPNVAIILGNLAQLFRDTNCFEKAEPLIRRALSIDEKSYGPDHPSVATDLSLLALLLQDTNRLSEAEPLIRRALFIDEGHYGKEHPKIAIRLNNLAGLLQATNRLSEAEPLMERALSIDEKSYGPDHPEVAIDLNNLAQLLQATNRFSEAEPLMVRALSIDKKLYAEEHPRVARDLGNLARLLQATNRLTEAEPLLVRALEICHKCLIKGHPWTETTAKNLEALRQARAETQNE